MALANGSLKELETRLLRARTRLPAAGQEIDELLESTAEVGRVLLGLIRALRAAPKSPAEKPRSSDT